MTFVERIKNLEADVVGLKDELGDDHVDLGQRLQAIEDQLTSIIKSDEDMPVRVIEMAMTKLEPTQDDVIVFWMPPELTHAQIAQIGQSFDSVIGGRFRYIMLVRDAVKIETIKGTPGLRKVQ